MEIIGHDVDVIQILGQFRDVVAGGDGLEARRNGGCQKQLPVLAGLALALEGDADLLDEGDEGGPVVGASGVLPVDVEAVEAVPTQELDGVVNEAVHPDGPRL